ncbi:hypothetical protein EYZ11_013066 [Aspergillus tanneri]|uniref:Uncharacterized protein n=1 Tax=Aspergillus tanneri TaxID=1220188 RepID=A0A4S3J0S6_9EURO|nr:hypothetical protein EYZ11_013066 [Aspergillus tanneri]
MVTYKQGPLPKNPS